MVFIMYRIFTTFFHISIECTNKKFVFLHLSLSKTVKFLKIQYLDSCNISSDFSLVSGAHVQSCVEVASSIGTWHAYKLSLRTSHGLYLSQNAHAYQGPPGHRGVETMIACQNGQSDNGLRFVTGRKGEEREKGKGKGEETTDNLRNQFSASKGF